MKRLIAVLTPIHRYLGLAFCLIFVAWFASGLVMIYTGMPEYGDAERVARLARLDPAAIQLGPADAIMRAQLGERPQHIRLTTLGSRPVYRIEVGGDVVTVYADDGTVLDPLTANAALGIVRAAFPERLATTHLLGTIDRPDQWTIETPFASTGPLHVIALGDPAATNIYVASNTGEIVVKTDRSSRFWGYAGPVMHWFYFTPFRVHGALWANVIVYGSLAGCCVCVLGLVIGTYRYSIARRYRQGTTSPSSSPYGGWLQWHHYAGLLFGALALTWVFSGMLSMEPWGVGEDNAPLLEQVDMIWGRHLDAAQFVISPASALDVLQPQWGPKELDLMLFMGRPFYRAHDPATGRTLIVTADQGAPAIKTGFTDDELKSAASIAMHHSESAEQRRLTDYDAYYYDRARRRPLPVMRVKFPDTAATWLYLDASDGSLVQHVTTKSRRVRWLYHGLHSLDFPGLYQSGWAWDAVIVTLCAGGLLLSLTSVIVGWRSLRGRRAA